MASTARTGERAIDGVTSGLIDLGQEVTWRAKHFGIWHTLTSRIAEYARPNYFKDVMVRGIFRRLEHHHRFVFRNGTTAMTDRFEYDPPLGVLGTLADLVFLRKYLERFLVERNQLIKRTAESDDWKRFLPASAKQTPGLSRADRGTS